MSTQSQMLPFHGHAAPVTGNCELLFVIGKNQVTYLGMDEGDVNSPKQIAPLNKVAL